MWGGGFIREGYWLKKGRGLVEERKGKKRNGGRKVQ